jgi:hypothetical protein
VEPLKILNLICLSFKISLFDFLQRRFRWLRKITSPFFTIMAAYEIFGIFSGLGLLSAIMTTIATNPAHSLLFVYFQELRLADLGLAENCTEVREMDDGEVRDAIRGIMVGVAQSICAGALSIGRAPYEPLPSTTAKCASG